MAFTYTKRKDGRLMKRISINGNIKTIYSSNPKDLEKQYIELKHLANNNIYIDDKNMTVGIWADKWVEIYKSNLEKATVKMYKDTIRLYIKPYIGNIPLKSLKQSDIFNMLNELDKRNITRKKDVALLTIKQILKTAVENDYIYKNVASNIKIKKHKSAEKKPLTENTIKIIEKLAKNNSDAFMVLFMIYTGVRREEIVPLKYKHINIDLKNILIKYAVYFEHNQPTLKNTKNEDERTIPIFNIIFDKLENMYKSHKKDDYIFTNKNNNIMSETCIKRKIEKVRKLVNKQIDLQNEKNNEQKEHIYFTAHQLRHTYTCILYKAGIDIKQAQQWLGHKDIKVLLDVYTHLDSQDNQNSIDKVNAFLK